MAQASERVTQTTKRSFDAIAYMKHMEAVGFTRPQAEALAEEQTKLIDDRLATKDDLEALRVATKADLEALRLSLEAKIDTKLAETKTETIKWFIGAGFAQAGLIVALLKLIH